MSKGLTRSTSRAPAQKASILRASISVEDLAISVADGNPGFGFAAAAGLPEGNFVFLGAVAYLQFSSSSSHLTATFTGTTSIGSVGTVDGDVSDAGEADICPSTAIGAATAKVSPVVRLASTAAMSGAVIDNTDGTKNININVLIDDAAIDGAVALVANGYIDLLYSVLGDD